MSVAPDCDDEDPELDDAEADEELAEAELDDELEGDGEADELDPDGLPDADDDSFVTVRLTSHAAKTRAPKPAPITPNAARRLKSEDMSQVPFGRLITRSLFYRTQRDGEPSEVLL